MESWDCRGISLGSSQKAHMGTAAAVQGERCTGLSAMGWTPLFITASSVPKWLCLQATSPKRSVRDEHYDDRFGHCKGSLPGARGGCTRTDDAAEASAPGPARHLLCEPATVPGGYRGLRERASLGA